MAKFKLSLMLIFHIGNVLLSLVEVVQSQTTSYGVCYRRVITYQAAYRSDVYYQSYKCGWLNLRRCRRTLYRPVSVMQSHSSSAFDCCSGYQRCGTNSTGCCTVCDPPCTNGGNCSRPDVCDCPPGWTGNACQTDIDECIERTDQCQQVCNNTAGSYRCSCRAGYRLTSDGYSCTDINECSKSIDRCDQNCHNAVGTYACSCDDGHQLGLDGVTCYDIDECAEGTDQCDQQCYNTNGGYSCNCTEPGYRLRSDGTTCQISSGTPFQIRFSLSTGSEASEGTCSQFVNENFEEKANALAVAISQQISQTCGCPYLENFIYSHRFFCDDMKTVIYQARFLVVDGTTAEDIQNTLQNWVLMKPFITVDRQQYQLDTSCSVVILEVGDTSCNATELASSVDSQVNLLHYYYAGGGGGALLLLLVIVGVIVTVCALKWKTSRKKRQNCTAPMERKPALKRQGVDSNQFQEEKNQHYQECYESPTSNSHDDGGGNVHEQQNLENYEVPSSTHHEIQPYPENCKVLCSKGEDVSDSNSNVYDTVY